MKFTQRAVDGVVADRSEKFFWDDSLPGFGIRIKPSGAKTYLIQYRRGARQRRYAIGACGTFRLEEARERARRLLVSIRDGGDPSGDRKQKRQAPTVQALAERYLEEYAETHKRPSSVKADRRNIENHIIPLIGRLTVADVTRADVDGIMRSVRIGATKADVKLGKRSRRIVRGGPGVANRCCALLSKMFNLAERWGLRPDGSNPCRHVTKNPERKMRRYLSADELGRLGMAIAEAERSGTETDTALDAIRLLVLTGARVSEILTTRWEHLDAARGCLSLPQSKTGAKDVYLSPAALEILNGIDRSSGSSWIIPGADPTKPLVNLTKPWFRVREQAKLGDVRLHDLRHSFASVGVAGGLTLPILGALLGHTQPATTARYAHLAADPLRQAVDLIGSRIAAAMQRGEEGAGVSIIKMPLPSGQPNRRG
jgi:integrase